MPVRRIDKLLTQECTVTSHFMVISSLFSHALARLTVATFSNTLARLTVAIFSHDKLSHHLILTILKNVMESSVKINQFQLWIYWDNKTPVDQHLIFILIISEANLTFVCIGKRYC